MQAKPALPSYPEESNTESTCVELHDPPGGDPCVWWLEMGRWTVAPRRISFLGFEIQTNDLGVMTATRSVFLALSCLWLVGVARLKYKAKSMNLPA